MSKRKNNQKSTQPRTFTEDARKAIVEEIENGLSKAEACRKYNVGKTSIYRWMEKYSSNYKKHSTTIIKTRKEASTYKEFKKELKHTYELLGRSQMEVMFLNELLKTVSEEYQIDFKKKYGTKLSNGSNKIS